MSQNKTTRIRAKSAKLFQQRKRPLSSKQNKAFDKTDFIQKVYSNIPTIQERPTSGRIRPKINSVQYGNSLYNQGGIQKQALLQQNIELKKKIHMLQQSLAQINSRFQASRSKVSKLNKNLNIQFQNQNLWTGKSSYLVTGVKNQYQNLKLKYKQKCQQLNLIKSQGTVTKLSQQLRLNQVLSKQNINLIKQLVQHQNRNKSLQYAADSLKGTTDKQQHKVNQYRILQQQARNSQLQKKLSKVKKQLEQTKQIVNQQNIKIKFLQKVIIQKDNSIHAFHKKNKKLQKDQSVYLQEVSRLNQQIKQNKQKYQQQINQQKQSEQRIITYQKAIFIKQIEDKVLHIQKLQKEVAYLTTLLSYWKPLDQEHQGNKKSPHRQQKYDHHYQNKKKQQQQKSVKSHNLKVAESVNLASSFINKISMDFSQAQKPSVQSQENIPRTQRRADKKYNQKSQKTRRVRQNQVQEIGQIIRFRLIAQRVSFDFVKLNLAYKHSAQLSQQQNDWNNQYINMKQCCQLMKKWPFYLNQEQSKLLSRYLIQDVTNDYIYCDQQNENKRGIVKSILKNIIGDYEVQKKQQQISQQTQIELGKYKSKISTILQQMYPGGLISKKKLLQIFVGSGFEIQEDIMEYIIGKLALKSQNLNSLNYRVLF